MKSYCSWLLQLSRSPSRFPPAPARCGTLTSPMSSRTPATTPTAPSRVDGTVTSSWGVPLVPFKMYKVDDGTGEITVLSRGGNRTPSKGSRVKVKGVVRDVAMFNGMPLGLHLEERDLDIRRN